MGEAPEHAHGPAAEVHHIEVHLVGAVLSTQRGRHRLEKYGLAGAGGAVDGGVAVGIQGQIQGALGLGVGVVQQGHRRVQLSRLMGLCPGTQLLQRDLAGHPILPDPPCVGDMESGAVVPDIADHRVDLTAPPGRFLHRRAFEHGLASVECHLGHLGL